jgi:hypothetical protein
VIIVGCQGTRIPGISLNVLKAVSLSLSLRILGGTIGSPESSPYELSRKTGSRGINIQRASRFEYGCDDAFDRAATTVEGVILRHGQRSLSGRLEPQHTAISLVSANIQIAVRRGAYVANTPVQIFQ